MIESDHLQKSGRAEKVEVRGQKVKLGVDRAMARLDSARLEPQFFLARTWLGSILARRNLARLGSSQDLLARQANTVKSI